MASAPDVLLPLLLLVAGFVLLIKGADWLVAGASSLAASMRVSPLIIGLTVVAFGTSSPELFVNVMASMEGRPEIAIGNVLGSNIFNILVILGISAILYPMRVQTNTVWKEIPFSLLAAIVLLVLAGDTWLNLQPESALHRADGIVLLLFFAVFMYYVLDMALRQSTPPQEEIRVMSGWKSTGMIVLGLALLVVGGNWIVDSAVDIARMFDISEQVIGLTVVAIGTSLPELATSLVAARKKNADIAVGNVVGSNIFNIFLILGVSSLVRPLPLQATSMPDIGMTIFASVLLFASMFMGRRHTLTRMEGGMFLTAYLAYLVWLLSQ